MMTNDILAEYISHNYGKCKLSPCKCRDPYNPRFGGAWVGKLCPDWVPVGAATWEGLMEFIWKDANVAGNETTSQPRNQIV